MFLLCSAVAFAAEQGGDGGGSARVMNLVWRIINFIIFLAIIYKVAGKRIKDFFSSRRHQIENELKDLDTRRSEAENRLKEIEQSIANLEQEREQILEQARKQGESIKENIISKAKESAEQIKERAQAAAEQERQQIVDELRSELAERVVGEAEKMISERLTKEDQEKLVNEYLTKVVLN
jgi:F-type H+-transporting ATPase subunit b